MTAYDELKIQLVLEPKRWLITGVAGFIGSGLLEELLYLNQTVIGLDNFSTGYQHNLEDVRAAVSEEQWSRFTFVHGDIRSFADCQAVCENVDYVLHQAALGSVPRSCRILSRQIALTLMVFKYVDGGERCTCIWFHLCRKQ